MRLSLNHYSADKIHLKFAKTWMLNNDKLYNVGGISSDTVRGGFKHSFGISSYYTTGEACSILKVSPINEQYSAEEFEELYSNSIAFPSFGLRNIYDPFNKKFYGVTRLCYDSSYGDGKYKRACFPDVICVGTINWEEGDEQLSSKLKTIDTATTWVAIMAHGGIPSPSTNLNRLTSMLKVWASFVPRYDVVNAQSIEDMTVFFTENEQVMLSPLFRAVRFDKSIILFADTLPVGVYATPGVFMLKENSFRIYEKELALAKIPTIVHKRLIRSKVVLL